MKTKRYKSKFKYWAVLAGLATIPCYTLPAYAQVNPYAGLDTTQINSATSQELSVVNYYRSLENISPLTQNTELNDAAQAHTNYLILENAFSHFETDTSNAQYTGQDPSQRGTYFGYDSSNGIYGEDLVEAPVVTADPYSQTMLYGSMADLFDAPYHRELMLDPEFADIGIGIGVNTSGAYPEEISTLDFGATTVSSSGTLVAYPFDGETDVPTSWTDYEDPDPLQGVISNSQGATVGYPITLFVYGDTFTYGSASITDASGQKVPFYLGSNADSQTVAVLIPKQPLPQGETFHVTVNATDNATSQANTYSWSFTTTGTQPYEYTAYSKDGTPLQSWSSVTGLLSALSNYPGGYIENLYGDKEYVEPDYTAYDAAGKKLYEWTSATGLLSVLKNHPAGYIKDAAGKVVYTQPDEYTAYDKSGHKLYQWSSVTGLIPVLKNYPGGYIKDAAGKTEYMQPDNVYKAFDQSGHLLYQWTTVTGLLSIVKNYPGGYITNSTGTVVYTQPSNEYKAYDKNGHFLYEWTSVTGLLSVVQNYPGGYITNSTGTVEYSQPSNEYKAYDSQGHFLYEWTTVTGLLSIVQNYPGGYITDSTGHVEYTQP